MTSTPVLRGEEITLNISDAAFEGKSIARVEGMVVFVEGGVPGDRVRALITKVKKQHAEARVLTIESPSDLRTDPACEHFGVCGGCRWQYVGYEAQLQFKQRHVVDSLERIGGLAGFEVVPILGCDDPYWYRNKMEYSFASKEWMVSGPPTDAEPEGVFLGLHVPRRYDKVLDIRRCHLQSDISNQILEATRSFARSTGLPVYSSENERGLWRFLVIRESRHTDDRMVNLVTNEHRSELMNDYVRHLKGCVEGISTIVNTINRTKSQIAFGQEVHVLDGTGTIREKLGRHEFIVSPQSFFQTNTLQAERLYHTALEFADVRSEDVVFDLYSGTGTIAIFMSERAKEVIGVESVASAVDDARVNAERNGRDNCRFVLGDLKDRLMKQHEWMEGVPRVVVTDPPRSGMHPDVVDALVHLSPERIVYVSCNPTTQARDAKLLAAGGYRLVKVRPVDMFPHTYHVENVALFERSA